LEARGRLSRVRGERQDGRVVIKVGVVVREACGGETRAPLSASRHRTRATPHGDPPFRNTSNLGLKPSAQLVQTRLGPFPSTFEPFPGAMRGSRYTACGYTAVGLSRTCVRGRHRVGFESCGGGSAAGGTAAAAAAGHSTRNAPDLHLEQRRKGN
jgi:hypothetical protein